jgi:ABC-type dipeptide/oligopeptide/nickel transport system ATPase subunit
MASVASVPVSSSRIRESGRRLRNYRAEVQMVFQDHYSALNPAKTLGYVLGRPLVNYQGLRGAAMREKVWSCWSGWR